MKPPSAFGRENYIGMNMDLIIHNAKIYTVDEKFSTVESFAVKDGKIAATGKSKYILEKYSADKIIDFNGKYIYPGFIDPHSHFYDYGKILLNADLTGACSFEEIIEILLDHKKKRESDWITGHGWDQNKWKVQKYPTRDQLDRAFPDTPVVLTRTCTHAALANTEALRRAGIDPGKSDEYVSQFLSEKGKLTGVVAGSAKNLLMNQIPEPGSKDILRGLKMAQEKCFAAGLTTVCNAGDEKRTIELLDSYQKKGDLKIRIYSMLKPVKENFEAFMYKGVYRTDRLNVCSVKLFADGALGSRGALLIEPYCDDTGSNGLHAETPENMRSISEKAFSYGYQVNTHCIGDLAARVVLDIYGSILKGPNDKRWRIEHAQIIHPADLDRFGKYSVIPSVQAIHAMSDMEWAVKRIGRERMKHSYIYKDLLNQNGWLANGSDFPVEPVNPLLGFYAAVARKNEKGHPPGGFQTENALSREEALRSMTIWAARANFEDAVKGTIEPGKYADFVITNDDIMETGIDNIKNIYIINTFLGGEKVN